jgi:hypothetical protein
MALKRGDNVGYFGLVYPDSDRKEFSGIVKKAVELGDIGIVRFDKPVQLTGRKIIFLHFKDNDTSGLINAGKYSQLPE